MQGMGAVAAWGDGYEWRALRNKQYTYAKYRVDGMELLFFYRCPHCLRHVPLVNPVEPRNVRCDGCGKQFPIIPVDEHGLHYVRIMLANGKAAANPDYL